MQCVTPMFRYYNSELEKDSNAKIIPRKEVLKGLSFDPNYIRHSVDDFNRKQEKKYSKMRIQTIPCGYCWACKLRKSAEWASRIVLETQETPHNYWITLTYDDEHLPNYETFNYLENDIIKETFENDGTWTGTLEPDDVTKFINTLRQHFHRKPYYIDGIKYFYCGEYGNEPTFKKGKLTMGYRPHYHMCIFGAPLDPKEFYSFKFDERHKAHWKSHELEDWWSKGIVDVCELEFSDAAYTARYTMKKLFTEPKSQREYAQIGKIPEFIRMSRRPGIGMRYFERNMDKIYDTDEIIMKTVKDRTGSRKPPKAFDRKYQELKPEHWQMIVESRKAAAERSDYYLKQMTDATDLKLLQMKTDEIVRIGNNLPRILE